MGGNSTTGAGQVFPRICVVGAGAIGGLIAGRLAGPNVKVTLVENGDRLEALRADGLTLISPSGERRTIRDLSVVGDPAEAGRQDLVFLAVKAQDLPSVAPGLPSLFHPDTVVVTLQNGIPWWYFQRFGGPLEGRRLERLDPDGVLERHVQPRRIVGCVVYPAAEMNGDCTVRHVEGEKLPVGELDGTATERVLALSGVLEEAGFRSRVLEDVRSELWLKALGSVSLNPISALTEATLEDICRFPATRSLAAAMMNEAQNVAEALGASLRVGIERRIAGAEAVGPHKTSMLQDLEAGRPLETEGLVGSVLELASITGTATPAIEAVYACVKLRESGTETGVRIRRMRDEDLSDAMAILERWDMAPTPDEADAERSGLEVANSFVAEQAGRVVGVASFIRLAPDVGETASLAVDPECRGLGIGYALQVARFQEMQRRGIRWVRTETDRPETISWYERKFGYRRVGTNPKKHAFSLPDVDHWTVLELDLREWVRRTSERTAVPSGEALSRPI